MSLGFGSPRQLHVFDVAAVLLLAAVGCGDDAADDGKAGAAAGTSAGSGAASGAGGMSGGGGSVGAGAGGSTAGAGAAGSGGGAGGAGSSGTGGGAAGNSAGDGASGADAVDMFSDMPPGLSDFDLGGLNEDLPEPADGEACLAMTDPVGCMTISGEYDGQPFACAGANIVYTNRDRARRAGCDADLPSGGALSAAVTSLVLGAPLLDGLPTAFDLSTSPQPEMASYLSFSDGSAGGWGTHDDDMFALESTHTFEAKLVGEAWLTESGTPGAASEFARGVFAATLEPLPGCTPDAEGVGCDAVRLRGVFNLRTLPVVALFAEGEQGCVVPMGERRCSPGLQCVIPSGAEFGTCMAP